MSNRAQTNDDRAEHAAQELSRQILKVRDMLAQRVDTLEVEVAEIAKDHAVTREMISQLVIGRAADAVSTRWVIGLIITGAIGAMFASIGSCIQQREDISAIKATIQQMQK